MSSALVLGAGISGLSCATALVKAGYRVRIVAAKPPLETVSAVAAAVWYPYKAYPADRVAVWGAHTLEELTRQAARRVPGVRMANGVLLWRGERPSSLDGLARGRAPRGWHQPDGYAGHEWINVPLAEMSVYLPHLLSELEPHGARIEHRSLSSIDEAVDIARRWDLDAVVVNCSGLGAHHLVGDTDLHPIRGQVAWVENPGLTDFMVDVDAPGAATYIVPRRNDCVLGGTAQVDDWSENPRESDAEDIVARCTRLEPHLESAKVLEHRAGLRPGRSAVRLEEESVDGVPVIHNYGHGGAGVTLSWGCAREVVSRARKTI